VVLLLRFWVFDDLASDGAAPFAAAGAGCGCSVLYRECPRAWLEVPLEDSVGGVCWAAIELSRDSLLRELMGRARLDCSASSLATFWRLFEGFRECVCDEDVFCVCDIVRRGELGAAEREVVLWVR